MSMKNKFETKKKRKKNCILSQLKMISQRIELWPKCHAFIRIYSKVISLAENLLSIFFLSVSRSLCESVFYFNDQDRISKSFSPHIHIHSSTKRQQNMYFVIFFYSLISIEIVCKCALVCVCESSSTRLVSDIQIVYRNLFRWKPIFGIKKPTIISFSSIFFFILMSHMQSLKPILKKKWLHITEKENPL